MDEAIGAAKVKGDLGRMLRLAETVVVQDAHTRQPAEMRAQADAHTKGRGLS
jgi:hypothetical protein